jgi:2-C-methyl-D-erythritol 2,4-cyclodiphosphate synthase
LSTHAGIGWDSHRLAEGEKLVLGGIEVEHDVGLVGHSDADALTHAVIDALLGAAGLGDIGQHFPDDDERYRGANSLDLLSQVCSFLEDHGWSVRHVDATVMAEAPKLGPYRDRMRIALAQAAGIDARSVNVKFTTGEGMGFVGRGEGMAAMAVATVERAD